MEIDKPKSAEKNRNKTGKKKMTRTSKKQNKKQLVSHLKKPEKMGVADWQIILRKQIASTIPFEISKLSADFAYGDYKVFNPQTHNTYKVAIRSRDNSRNFCTCYDFKTNLLGTCKHVEAVLEKIGKNKDTRKALKVEYTPPYSSFYIDYRSSQTIKLRIGTDNSEEYHKLFEPFISADFILNDQGYAEIDHLLERAYHINNAFRCYEDAFELIIRHRETKERETFLQPFIQNKNFPPDIHLNTTLFPYQVEGALFCALAGRSILADDMGLGKTIQAIAVAQLMQERFGIQNILIICPTSLKYQWKSEIEKFTGKTVLVVEGNPLKREGMYFTEEVPYKITSYHAATNDWKYINDAKPDLIILDEAQRIKNWRTKVSQSVKKLQSKYALVLTGTPLENNLEELYSLVQFVNPTLMGSLYNFLSTYQVKDEDGKVIGYKDLNKVAKSLKYILLRRTKKEVLKQLPERRDQNIFITITERQREIHTEYADVVARIVSMWRKLGFLKEEQRKRLMISMNMMRMVCNSTYIIDQETNHQTKLDELFSILEQILAIPGEKVVIFSQWERMTRLVAKELDLLGVLYQNLHGSVPSKKRKDLLDEFQNNDDCKIFLSTDAGGVGLNLQKASYLINLDIPWNPAVLEQRIGRIHRLGQKKNVNIINLIAQNTIEHRMLELLRFKSSLAAGILDNGEPNIFLGESKFNKFMQAVEEIIAEPFGQADSISEAKEELQNTESISKTSAAEAQNILEVDDDIKTEKNEESLAVVNDSNAAGLIETGMQFMQQLQTVLNNQEATRDLVKSITQKDPVDGKTYLKIPVENESVIYGLFQFLGGMLKK